MPDTNRVVITRRRYRGVTRQFSGRWSVYTVHFRPHTIVFGATMGLMTPQSQELELRNFKK